MGKKIREIRGEGRLRKERETGTEKVKGNQEKEAKESKGRENK